MPRPQLRPALEEEIPLLEEMLLLAGREMMMAARDGWDEERERQQFRRQLDLASTRIIQHEDRDVGFVTVIIGERVAEIHSLYVLPKWQGRGIGTAVTSEVVEAAKRAGRRVELSVLKANPRARALYERLGFAVVSETERHQRMCCSPGGSPWSP